MRSGVLWRHGWLSFLVGAVLIPGGHMKLHHNHICCRFLMKWKMRQSVSCSFPLVRSVLVLCGIVVLGLGLLPARPSFARTFLTTCQASSGPFDFANRTVTLDHEVLTLTHGVYRSTDGRHAARVIDCRVNRSQTRAAAILIDNPEGSGVFAYLIGAARTDGKEVYSAPVFLGDRIRIEAVRVSGTIVTVWYLDRPSTAPLWTTPTQRVVARYAIHSDGTLHLITARRYSYWPQEKL